MSREMPFAVQMQPPLDAEQSPMTCCDLTLTDLRELAEVHLGPPLAASAHAALWRCPVCPPERHALLMVSAHEYKCLSGYPCDAGSDDWLRSRETALPGASA